jgi:membrane protease YdiL (CAAX protease family)
MNQMTHARRFLEMLVVFMPAFLVILFAETWVGDNPLARQGVIWVAYVVMLVLAYTALRLQGTDWRHLGLGFEFAGWRRVLITLGQGVVIFLAATLGFAVGAVLMANIVGIPEGADFQSYDYLQGNLLMLAVALPGVYISASFGEEVLFRGYLMTRCAEFFGSSKAGWRVAITVSAVVFALIHYDWGISGIVQTGFMGWVLAYAYVRVNRNLWANIVAHGIMDTILMVQLYLA